MPKEVKDIYNNEKKYKYWLEEVSKYGIDGVSKKNSELIVNYVKDMEEGKNIAKGSKKGARSFVRLNSIRIRLVFLAKLLENRKINDLEKLDVHKISELFNDMRTGRLKKLDGGVYQSVADYAKIFISFWHWLMKVRKKEGNDLKDITDDLDTSREENSFVYVTKEDLDKLLPYFTPDEQVRILFMYDSIIRSPTELMNVKVSDFTPDFKELRIREEASKTFGRQIKIMLSSEELKKYAERNKFKGDDFMFVFSAPIFNQKLRKVAKQLFGDRTSKGGRKYSELTMYDFRHSGACYWRTGAYTSKIDALMYRGGWSNLDMLNYYTKTIGMKDTIEKDDLLIEADKNELQKKIDAQQKELDSFRKNSKKSLNQSEKAIIMLEMIMKQNPKLNLQGLEEEFKKKT